LYRRILFDNNYQLYSVCVFIIIIIIIIHEFHRDTSLEQNFRAAVLAWDCLSIHVASVYDSVFVTVVANFCTYLGDQLEHLLFW